MFKCIGVKKEMLRTWSTNSFGIGDPSGRASADHGSHRYGIEHGALSAFHARSNNWARLDALLIDAGQLGRAVRVFSAFGLVWYANRCSLAVRERITQGQVLGTATGSRVVGYVANSVLGTR